MITILLWQVQPYQVIHIIFQLIHNINKLTQSDQEAILPLVVGSTGHHPWEDDHQAENYPLHVCQDWVSEAPGGQDLGLSFHLRLTVNRLSVELRIYSSFRES